MKRKNLLSFLGIIACLLLIPEPVAAYHAAACGMRLDKKTILLRNQVRTNDDHYHGVDIQNTLKTGKISCSDFRKTSSVYISVWDGENWGEWIPIVFWGSFDRAGMYDDVNPYVCEDSGDNGTWMAITKPAGDPELVGTFTVANSKHSQYYKYVRWGSKGSGIVNSLANGFTQHALDVGLNSEKKAYNTTFNIEIDWKMPSWLAGKKFKVMFLDATYDHNDSYLSYYSDNGFGYVPYAHYEYINKYGDIQWQYRNQTFFVRDVFKEDLTLSYTPEEGEYVGLKMMKISCPVDGATIYYTTDGSTPTTSSTVYTGPIGINETMTIKAMAANDSLQGDPITVNYTVHPLDYVDLGLPSGTIWATKNVGASKDEDFGNYYAWGEVEPKDTYTRDNYKWGKAGEFTKYQNDDRYVLEVQDDAASMNWGAQWRMPTKAQIEELRDYCNFSWIVLDGVQGCLYTSKKDGTKSIFLPGAGDRDDPYYIDSYVRLNASDIYYMPYGSRWRVVINREGQQEWYPQDNRHIGMTVRPVMNPNQPVTEYVWISGTADKTYYQVGDQFDVTGLKVTYLPKESSAEKVTDGITWTVEPAVIYCGCTSVMVTASYKGVTSEPFKVAITTDGMPVDLGLSVQWSNFNLGSSSFTGYGNYYAWDQNLNDSIATIFGNEWRLPTEAEVKELQDTAKCIWKWYPAGNSQHGGVAGYRVIGKSTGNFIFLPAAGCQSGSNIVGKGSVGNYWTSTEKGSDASYMCFDMYDQCIGTDIPTNGRAIRVVKK
ncbi:MAG: chitobiase/beta-hexosaminidase C-terminal domain-containing protein [Paludibacteraceae bacterium]|nr:chitobiase/beta-hexosaminidase C-terminal domain-containing protein [Paludibacteraceae bacterium]